VVKLPFYKSNLVSTKYKALKFFEIDWKALFCRLKMIKYWFSI
jgi:hypothetical protein